MGSRHTAKGRHVGGPGGREPPARPLPRSAGPARGGRKRLDGPSGRGRLCGASRHRYPWSRFQLAHKLIAPFPSGPARTASERERTNYRLTPARDANSFTTKLHSVPTASLLINISCQGIQREFLLLLAPTRTLQTNRSAPPAASPEPKQEVVKVLPASPFGRLTGARLP